MSGAANVIEGVCPIDLVHGFLQFLGLRNVVDVRKAIGITSITNAVLVQLSGKIVSAIDADLNVKRKPGLNASVQPTEPGMDFVVIDEFAFSISGDKFEFLDIFVTIDFVGAAGFNASKHRDESFGDTIGLGDGSGVIFFS